MISHTMVIRNKTLAMIYPKKVLSVLMLHSTKTLTTFQWDFQREFLFINTQLPYY